MDNQSRPATPPQLQKINLDIIFSIVGWLDPLTILSLSCSCKYFQDVIGDDHLIWRHALEETAFEHCIAPHSLDGLSIKDLKLFSTHPVRLINHLRDPKRAIQPKATKIVLDFAALLAASPTSNPEIEPQLEYLAPDILPGGRWIISGVVNHTDLSTRICCWDRSNFASEDVPFQPVASFIWEGFKPPTTDKWFRSQLEEPSSVMLACPVDKWDSAWETSYVILRVDWSTNEGFPMIKTVATLAHDDYRALDDEFYEYHLEGNYLFLENIGAILVWDWQQNRMGRIDDEGHEWANGSGFLMAALPPYIFILPHEMNQISVAELPQLPAVGTAESHKRMRLASNASYPLVDHIESLMSSSLYILDTWKPPLRRSGTAVLCSDRWSADGGPLCNVISLRPTSTTPPSPSYVQQPSEPFHRDLLEGVGAVILELSTEEPAGEDMLHIRFYPFMEGNAFGTPVERSLSPLCLVSGTTLLRGRESGADPYTQIVGIISLEF
ncbi:hypothetical protein DL93DRAFT_2159375 [Clavulina sp. PMI_390]|nr:hypothetical protein DL93DRAFT_2159375 [Clavulina sp. PMI_390]